MSRGQEIAERIRAGHDELFALIDPLTSEELMRPGVNSEWSLKDLIGHIGTYEWFVAEFFRKRGWPEMPSEIDLPDLDERNAAIYQWLKDRPLDRIRDEEVTAYAGLIEVVAGLDDADFEDRRRLGLPDGPEWQTESFVAGNSYDHYREHIGEVRRWVAELRQGSETA